MKDKKWITLNAHGKYCLERYLFAISASDLLTSQLDYLFKKDLVDYANNLDDSVNRQYLANHKLTDLGIETARHYFPGITIHK
jgi:hypothetical protein